MSGVGITHIRNYNKRLVPSCSQVSDMLELRQAVPKPGFQATSGLAVLMLWFDISGSLHVLPFVTNAQHGPLSDHQIDDKVCIT